MIQKDKRIRIITGHYGSGKTEFAVNYAVNLKNFSPKVALSDLDIVNVYFRSRERREELEQRGIKVIASSIQASGADLPAVSAAISTPIRDKSYDYIIDLGGDDVGTVVLGRLKPILNPEEIDFLMVVNTNRPKTSDVTGIIQQKNRLESAAGLKVTGFVNNTNLIRETLPDTLLEGDRILKDASEKTAIPIRYVSYVAELLPHGLPEGITGEPFPLEFYMRQSWM